MSDVLTYHANLLGSLHIAQQQHQALLMFVNPNGVDHRNRHQQVRQLYPEVMNLKFECCHDHLCLTKSLAHWQCHGELEVVDPSHTFWSSSCVESGLTSGIR